jgi:D-cysteine desulfhydrase
MDARRIAARARRTLTTLGRHGVDVSGASPAARDLMVETDWLGAGYGHPTQAGERATRLFADRVEVTLEPVYTAKAVAAVLELNRRGAFGAGPLLYWHTYTPSNANPVPGRGAGEATGI